MGMNQSELCGKVPCISIILHYLLKELPTELVSSNAVEILQLIECSKDYSFDQVFLTKGRNAIALHNSRHALHFQYFVLTYEKVNL